MKTIKSILGAIAGAVVGTVLCWGLLYVYGTVVLRGEGSLFDTNPRAANTFFIGWLIVSVLFAVGGAIRAILSGTDR